MIHDEDLQTCFDYSEGQKQAARMVLVELANLFTEYKDNIRIVGGWVPDLMFQNEGHVGSIDVDILLNHLVLQDTGYMTMEKILSLHNYQKHPEKYFSYVKKIIINNVEYDVDVDFLAGKYGGTDDNRRSQHLQGLKVLKATGGNFAFNFEPQNIKITAQRPDGAIDVAHINVVAVVPYLVMKTEAMGRGKAKDAYDIYFVIKHYDGGVDSLAEEFKNYANTDTIRRMLEKLSEKFADENYAGPVDVANFVGAIDDEENDMVRRDAYEQVQDLIKAITKYQDTSSIH